VDTEELLSVADGPELGAVNVTVTLGTGLPSASVTSATSELPNAVPTVVLCGLPLLTAMFAAVPAVFVSENEAGAATPETSALTE
jgi:hypothetical protein